MEREKHIRPWGYYENLASGPGYLVKRIVVDPGKRTSLQWHEDRGEDWVVVSGSGEVTATTAQNRWRSSKSKRVTKLTGAGRVIYTGLRMTLEDVRRWRDE